MFYTNVVFQQFPLSIILTAILWASFSEFWNEKKRQKKIQNDLKSKCISKKRTSSVFHRSFRVFRQD